MNRVTAELATLIRLVQLYHSEYACEILNEILTKPKCGSDRKLRVLEVFIEKETEKWKDLMAAAVSALDIQIKIY